MDKALGPSDYAEAIYEDALLKIVAASAPGERAYEIATDALVDVLHRRLGVMKQYVEGQPAPGHR